MKIILNGREEKFERETMSVSEMLDLKKFSFRMRIVKVNGKLIPRDDYGSSVINDGDNVQMFYLMSGG
jgi:thiamine biosynthesis protein ThiS